MTAQSKFSSLLLPGLRARMGNWVYYICFLKMRDIAERISIAKEIHSSEALQELLQRQLKGARAREIKEYLLCQKERFFNALVVGSYGGSPRWYELSIKPYPGLERLPDYMEGSLGVLQLEGSERLFAIDGQHRIAGIREALDEDSDLGDDEVCVIFVAGVVQEHRNDDPIGFERTRRLFTTLNRYAKPVGKRDIIALDEDDIVAIVTRRLVEEYPLFQDKISVKQAKNIPPTDRQSFTTIIALYDALDIFFMTRRGWKNFKRFRPSDDDIKRYYERAVELWSAFEQHFPPISEMRDSRKEDLVAGKYRNEQGGHLLFRPVGLLVTVRCIRRLCDDQVRTEEAVERVSKVPMDLNSEPWVNLLWDPVNTRMITAPENQKAAEILLYHAVGGNLSDQDLNDLKSELAGLLHTDRESVRLPRYV